MDFITGFPRMVRENDAFTVVVDTLRKENHFTSIKYTFRAIDVSDVFMNEIFILDGLPKTIISNKNVKFT
jgi:hypothetical protein